MSGILHARLRLLVATTADDLDELENELAGPIDDEVEFDDEPTHNVELDEVETRTLTLGANGPRAARNDNAEDQVDTGDRAKQRARVEDAMVADDGERGMTLEHRRAVIAEAAERARVDASASGGAAASGGVERAGPGGSDGDDLDEVAEEIESIEDERQSKHAWRRARAPRMQN